MLTRTLLPIVLARPSRPFTLTVDTTKAGSASDTFVLPLPSSGTYNYSVDWGDGVIESYTTNTSKTHVYAVAGVKTIRITGTFPRIFFNNAGDRLKLTGVALGSIVWGSFDSAFWGCSNLVTFDATGSNTASVTNMFSMFRECTAFNQSVSSFNTAAVTLMSGVFYGCSAFNQSVSNFNTAAVTNMDSMFLGCTVFNQSVSNFNTASVTNMGGMFQGCTAFNQSVSNLNTSAVTTMGSMFFGCTAFNQSVSNFNTASVTNMAGVFYGCAAFNQSVSNLNTAAVTNMDSMFLGCTVFNQSVSNFNTASVTNMAGMFQGCTAFNQDVSGWSIVAMTNATLMFTNSGFAKANYDLLLPAWEAQVERPNVTFSAGSARYSAGAPTTARAALVSSGWIITDGGTP